MFERFHTIYVEIVHQCTLVAQRVSQWWYGVTQMLSPRSAPRKLQSGSLREDLHGQRDSREGSSFPKKHWRPSLPPKSEGSHDFILPAAGVASVAPLLLLSLQEESRAFAEVVGCSPSEQTSSKTSQVFTFSGPISLPSPTMMRLSRGTIPQSTA